MQELRTALRTLRKMPGFTLVAVLTLALGIGAVTATFSVVNAVLLRPLPYGAPDDVVRVHSRWAGQPEASISPAEYFDYLERVEAWERFGVWAGGAANLTGGDRPERVRAAFVSHGALPALGIRPHAGRLIRESDDVPGAAPVVVLSHGLWQRYFGGDPGLIGREIEVSGGNATVVGVLPPGFALPDDLETGETRGLYVPLAMDRTTVPNRGSHFLEGVARLAPGTTLAQARAELEVVTRGFVERYPEDYPTDMRFGAWQEPVAEAVTGDVRPMLLVLLGAVAFVLLIACANVASLMLTRTEERGRELAVRAALGAGRRRLARLLATESLVLATIGGVIGVVLAAWGVHFLATLQPPDIPRVESVAVDARVLLFSLGATLFAALVFGLSPVLTLRTDIGPTLREGGRGGPGGRAAGRFRAGLLAAEFTLALLLLSGAGLLVRTMAGLLSVDPGYRTENVLTVRLSLPSASYPRDEDRHAFFAGLVHRLDGRSGVVAAGASSHLPLETSLGDIDVQIEGRRLPETEVSPALDWQVVTPGYFEAMGIRVPAGRALRDTDRADAPGAAVISRAAADMLFPDETALGKRLLLGGGAGPGWVEIVGIAEDVRHAALSADARPEIYLPHAQFHFWNGGTAVAAITLVLHTRGDPAALAPLVRRQVAALDPALPLAEFRTMDQVAAASLSRPRFAVTILGSFALIALILAAVGIYGTTSYLVSRRTRELGIRLVLGARPAAIVRSVLAYGMRSVAIGAGLGLAGALLLNRALAGLLYGVEPTDPVTLAGGTLLLAAVAFVAALVPARRVGRIDPVRALGGE